MTKIGQFNYFRYGNVLGDSSDTFGPGSLMIDNVLVTRGIFGPNTIPAIGGVGVGVTVLLLLAGGVLIINKRQGVKAERVEKAPPTE